MVIQGICMMIGLLIKVWISSYTRVRKRDSVIPYFLQDLHRFIVSQMLPKMLENKPNNIISPMLHQMPEKLEDTTINSDSPARQMKRETLFVGKMKIVIKGW